MRDQARFFSYPSLTRNAGNRGQTLVEYAYILAFISMIAVAVMISLGKAADNSKITVTHQMVIAQSSH